MTKITTEDAVIIKKLCAELKFTCKDHTIGQVMHALTVFTTDVLLQADEKPTQFIENLTVMSSDVFKLFLAYSAAKENGDVHTLQ